MVRYGIPAEVGSGQGSGGASSCGGSGQSKPSQKQVPTVIHIEHVDKLSETPAQLMNRLVITKSKFSFTFVFKAVPALLTSDC